MKNIFYASMTVLVLCLCSLVVACRNSNAGGADLSHMYNTLHAPKATAVMADVMFHRSHRGESQLLSMIGEAEAAVFPSGTGCPTVQTKHPHYYDITTCDGIHAQVSEAPTANDQSFLLPPQDGSYQVFYDAPGCSGQAYIRESDGVGGTDLVQGDAIFIDVNFTGPTDKGNYLWVDPTKPVSGSVNIASFWDGGSCQASATTQTGLYPLTQMPEGGTGVGWPNAPVGGPVFIGPAG